MIKEFSLNCRRGKINPLDEVPPHPYYAFKANVDFYLDYRRSPVMNRVYAGIYLGEISWNVIA